MFKKIRDTLEGLDENLHQFYEKKADGKFHLKLEDDDAEPLRRAKEHEVGLRQIAERDRDAAKEELEKAKTKITELERAVSSSTQELRADHERAVRELNEKHAKDTEGLQNTIREVFVNQVASSIAGDIAIDEGAAELLSEVIQKRLQVEMVNGKPVTRVLNADGTASNKSPDDLKNEYLQTKKYAAILRANDASGGGANGGSNGGGATGKKLADLGDEERNKLARENPAELQRLVDEARREANSR